MIDRFSLDGRLFAKSFKMWSLEGKLPITPTWINLSILIHSQSLPIYYPSLITANILRSDTSCLCGLVVWACWVHNTAYTALLWIRKIVLKCFSCDILPPASFQLRCLLSPINVADALCILPSHILRTARRGPTWFILYSYSEMKVIYSYRAIQCILRARQGYRIYTTLHWF